MRDRMWIAGAALALVALTQAADAQSRTLYATAPYGPHQSTMITGGAIVGTFPNVANGGYGLAVSDGTIRTVGTQLGNTGGVFSTGGSYLGPDASNTIAGSDFYDGTTDGTYNYTVDFDGGVFRAALDWGNLTQIFTSVYTRNAGITYDSGHNSLWIGQYNGNGSSLTEFNMDGSVRSSFNPNLMGQGITALAYDYVDQTLWFSNYTGAGVMQHYDRTGNFIEALTITGQDPVYAGSRGYFLGAEFSLSDTVTPEPASLALFATGLLGIAGVMRRRRSRS